MLRAGLRGLGSVARLSTARTLPDVRVGVIGTSWWTDAMYLPALATPHDAVQSHVVAICGRREEPLQDMASRWSIPHRFTDWQHMIDRRDELGLDAVIIAATDEWHYDMAVACLDAGMHVCCEKPIAATWEQSKQLRDKVATVPHLNFLVPFTYEHMPSTQHAIRLVHGPHAILGAPLTLNARYFAAYSLNDDYLWRFDAATGGSGALGDIASHFIHIARLLYGDIDAVCAHLPSLNRQRPTVRPDGSSYAPLNDSAALLVRFANGAQGVLHASSVSHERYTESDTNPRQLHEWDLHGTDGCVKIRNDWGDTEVVSGAPLGQPVTVLPTPPDLLLPAVRTDCVHNTYKDVFRTRDVMVRRLCSAIAEGRDDNTARLRNFEDGFQVQRVVRAAQLSADSGHWVELDSVE